jgi:hypothetical protein
MIRKFISKASNGNEQVFLAMMLAAVFLTMLRLLAPIELWWDESIQLNAANRLANGLGLTTTCSPFPEQIDKIPSSLLQAPRPQYLNSFPPGYSLLVAGFLLLRIPLVFSLKIIYSILTIAGWLGWAIIASRCLVKPVKLLGFSFPIQIIVAAILPVFYTPGWRGTDLFLWAGVPYLVLMLFYSELKSARYLILAGLLLGVEFSIRFAALSLYIFAFCTVAQKNFPKIKEICSKFALFVVSSLTLTVPVIIYVIITNIINGSSGVNQITFRPELYYGLGLSEIFLKILQSASAISSILGLPLQTGLAYQANPSIYLYVLGAFFLLLVFMLPVFLIVSNPRARFKGLDKSLLLTLSFIPLSTVIFLFACNLFGKYDFLGTPRYYVPALLPVIFISYSLATNEIKKSYKFVKVIFLLFIITFCVYNVAARPLGWRPWGGVNFIGIGFRIQTNILSSYVSWKEDFSYPSNKILTLYDETSAKMRELQKENPDALFFVGDCPVFVYDGYTGFRPVPMSRYWEKAEVNESVKVFWAVSQKCSGVCTSHKEEVDLGSKINESAFETVFISSKENGEKMKIVVSDFPAGFKFS